MRTACMLLVCLASLALASTADAQEVIYSRYKQFRIPFQAPSEQNLKQLQLFVSTDQGRTWAPSSTAAPDQGHFRFISDRDANYWFAVQTLDATGKLYPTTLDNAQPSLKVIVDTLPPAVTLQALTPRNGEVGIGWDVRDDNPDNAPDSVRLEYRPVGSASWLPLGIAPGKTQHYWNPRSPGQIEVRIQVRDKAGNVSDASGQVSLSGQGGAILNPGAGSSLLGPGNNDIGFQPPTNNNPVDFLNPPADADRKFVNNTRVTLHYNLENLGPSGISYVELWYTLDGRSWTKYPLRFGEDPKQRNITFDVAREGLYGLSLVAKSGVGLGESPPKIGDRPQMWIEVDSTKPVVKLQNVLVGQGVDKGKLTVTWNAQDRFLTREPITISYASEPTGPWTNMATKLPNTGRYVWSMPADVPYQFYVRVEAVDQAANVGDAASEAPIKVDLALPKAVPTLVEPGR